MGYLLDCPRGNSREENIFPHILTFLELNKFRSKTLAMKANSS
jgi:hypothetical protein